MIREAYSYGNGEPMVAKNGYTAVEWSWDSDGKIVSETWIPAETAVEETEEPAGETVTESLAT